MLCHSCFLYLSGKRVGRITELKAEEVIEQVDTRTIAASPLEYNVKLENVESFFTQFAKVMTAFILLCLHLFCKFSVSCPLSWISSVIGRFAFLSFM